MKNLSILFISASLFFSCGEDEVTPVTLEDPFETGVIILNEGNFTESDASVSFYDGQEVAFNVFQTVNDFPILGSTLQSAVTLDTLLFLVVNNSNKVEVVNRQTLASISTIELLQPRYMAVAGDFGYITEWVAFGEPGNIAIVDLLTNTVTKRIEIGSLPEDIEVINGELYVTEAFGNKLYKIDIATEEIVTYTIRNGAEQMVVDQNADLWIACEGGSDESFNPLNDGALLHFDTETNEVIETFEINANFQGKLAINGDRSIVYLPVGNNVFTYGVGSSSISTEPFIVGESIQSIYGIGVDPESGQVFIGDSKSFSDDGEVFVYEANGSLTTSFMVGRGPNGFVFN